MSFPDCSRSRFAMPAIFALLLSAGCGTTDDDPKLASRDPFTAMTTGSASEQMDYLEQLAKRYVEIEPSDPPAARKLLLEYTSAVIGTAEADARQPANHVEREVMRRLRVEPREDQREKDAIHAIVRLAAVRAGSVTRAPRHPYPPLGGTLVRDSAWPAPPDPASDQPVGPAAVSSR